jgi:hypothetical protein
MKMMRGVEKEQWFGTHRKDIVEIGLLVFDMAMVNQSK